MSQFEEPIDDLTAIEAKVSELMFSVSDLSHAANDARHRTKSPAITETYFATNRCWHELQAALTMLGSERSKADGG